MAIKIQNSVETNASIRDVKEALNSLVSYTMRAFNLPLEYKGRIVCDLIMSSNGSFRIEIKNWGEVLISTENYDDYEVAVDYALDSIYYKANENLGKLTERADEIQYMIKIYEKLCADLKKANAKPNVKIVSSR